MFSISHFFHLIVRVKTQADKRNNDDTCPNDKKRICVRQLNESGNVVDFQNFHINLFLGYTLKIINSTIVNYQRIANRFSLIAVQR